MVSTELEGFPSSGVDTFLVGEEVSVWSHLSDDRSVRHDLFLNSINLGGEAEVNHLIQAVGLSAGVLLKMLVWAFTLCSFKWVACFWEESSSLSPS